jgi:hypothetical protein
LLYDWRFTADEFVLVKTPLKLTTSSSFFFKLNICDYCPYVISSLMRGWVCHLQLLLVLASVIIFRSESRAGLMATFNFLRFDTPLNLEGQVPIFISPRNRVSQLYPKASFVSYRVTYIYHFVSFPE